MSKYTLTLNLNNQQLDTFWETHSNVIVAKPASGEGKPNVAWQAFSPLESNIVEWEEQYGIYASTVAISNGAVLTQMSSTHFPSAEKKEYELKPSGSFEMGGEFGELGSFYATNECPLKPFLTLGLYQDATVNGHDVPGNAISAAPVLIGSTAQMTPFTTVYAWVQSEVQSNTVVTHITSKPTKLLFGGDITDISLAYDSATGLFISPS